MKNVIKKSHKVESGDIENLIRLGNKPVPRVLKPYILDNFGFNTYIMYYLIKFITYKDLHGRNSFDKMDFFINFNKKTGLKPIRIFIDICGKGVYKKVIRDPYELPPDSFAFFKVWTTGVLDEFMANVFPHYLHFLFKDTPITPFPVPYLEFYMKSGDGNLGNLMENLRDGDVPSDAII